MQPSLQSKRLTGLPRARLLAVATLVSVVLVAGCGGSSTRTTAASPGGATNSGATVAARSGAANPGSTAPGALAFARCMRSSGVPNFPDPQPGGGFLFSTAGINPSAPALRAARAKCQKVMPGGGPPGPGSTTHPSGQTLAKLLNIAQCMRQHAVPEFPDPRTTVPLNPFGSGSGVITDYDGAILLFPSTIDMQSPAYTRAAAACGALAEKLGRGPH
jgi:hypothetical protein